MTLTGNLLPRLLETGIRNDEVPGFVRDTLGLSHVPGKTRAVAPWRGPTQLVLKFDRADHLTEVTAGEALTSESFDGFREKMRSEFESTGTRVARRVWFSTAVVIGEWTWRDRVRIAPVPAGAPTANFLAPDAPFLVEFAYRSIRGAMANFRRRLETEKEIHLLLNGLLQPPLTVPRPRSLTNGHHHWVLVGDPSKNDVQYCQEYYSFDGIGGEPDRMGELGRAAPLEIVAPQEYHNDWVHSCIGRPMKVPADLGEGFDALDGLSSDERDKCLRACFWLGEANEARSLSQAFLCVIQAIESLIPTVESGENCPTCHKPTGPGPTRRFREFVETWAPISDGAAGCESRDGLYGVRSGLSHAFRNPFLDDAKVMMEITPRSVAERDQLDAVLRACRISVRNWLLRSRLKVTNNCRKPETVESFSTTL